FVLAQELRRRGWETLVVVRKDDPARAKLEEAGIASIELDLRGIPRSLSFSLFLFPFKLAGAVFTAGRLVRDYIPAGVFAMGGYLTLPCVAAAATRHVPRLAHE